MVAKHEAQRRGEVYMGDLESEDDPDAHTDLALLHMLTSVEKAAIIHKTSFFYFVELQVCDPKAMKSRQTVLFITLFQFAGACGVAASAHRFTCPRHVAGLV